MAPLGQPGSTLLTGGSVQKPYGRYRLEPTSPTSVESIRMITIRIKLDSNIVQGETDHFPVSPVLFFTGSVLLVDVID